MSGATLPYCTPCSSAFPPSLPSFNGLVLPGRHMRLTAPEPGCSRPVGQCPPGCTNNCHQAVSHPKPLLSLQLNVVRTNVMPAHCAALTLPMLILRHELLLSAHSTNLLPPPHTHMYTRKALRGHQCRTSFFILCDLLARLLA